LSIFQNSAALVRETRKLNLQKGFNAVKFYDVPREIYADSVIFRDENKNPAQLIDQTFSFDLVDQYSMFEKFLGKNISVFARRGEMAEKISGKLLNFDYGSILLETENAGISLIRDFTEAQFTKLPADFSLRPTLIWTIFAPKNDSRPIETQFLTGGISWRATFNGEISADETKLTLEGFANIRNGTKIKFPNATISLVSGKVATDSPEPVLFRDAKMVGRGGGNFAEMDNFSAPQFSEDEFFEFKKFSLDRKTALPAASEKQIALFSPTEVPVKKEFVFDGRKNRDQVFVEFVAEKFEKSLPAGKLRIFKNGEFLGETNSKAKAKNAEMRIAAGVANEISAEFKILSAAPEKSILQKCERRTEQIELQNSKSEPVEVVIFTATAGEITDSKFNFERIENGVFKTKVKIEPAEKKLVEYSAKSCF
jgi:hypothetical protein